jgi:hypothetical protein
MLGKSQTRLSRGLLLVVYFLATTTAALFHDHSTPCDHDHSIVGTTSGVETTSGNSCEGEHLASCHEEGAVRSEPALPCPSSDDECAACRFLGLCSLPVAPPTILASHDLLVAANPAEPIHQSRPIDRTLHSRAPPRLG